MFENNVKNYCKRRRAEINVEQLHLDVFQEEYSSLCYLYWKLNNDGEFKYKISEVANAENLRASQVSSLVRKSCVAYSNTVFCVTCEMPRDLSSRTEYQSHERYSAEWQCKGCIELEEKVLAEGRKRIIHNFIDNQSMKPLDIDSLTLKEAVYLLSFIRYCINEMLDGLNSFSFNKNDVLTPYSDFDKDIIAFLYRRELLFIDSDTPENTFEIEKGRVVSYIPIETIWRLSFKEGDCLNKAFSRLESLLSSREFIRDKRDDLVDLINEINLMECLAELNRQLAVHRLPFNPGEKTKLVLSKALETFSVAQMYRLIWGACKDAAAFYMQGGVSKTHAANSVVGKIERTCERAISDGWNVSDFNRTKVPQSLLSRVIFNTVLGTNDGGFNSTLKQLSESFALSDE